MTIEPTDEPFTPLWTPEPDAPRERLSRRGAREHMTVQAQKVLNNLASSIVGEGRTSGFHFLTDCEAHNVVAVFVGLTDADAVLAVQMLVDCNTVPMVLESSVGVVWENEAAIELGARLTLAI